VERVHIHEKAGLPNDDIVTIWRDSLSVDFPNAEWRIACAVPTGLNCRILIESNVHRPPSLESPSSEDTTGRADWEFGKLTVYLDQNLYKLQYSQTHMFTTYPLPVEVQYGRRTNAQLLRGSLRWRRAAVASAAGQLQPQAVLLLPLLPLLHGKLEGCGDVGRRHGGESGREDGVESAAGRGGPGCNGVHQGRRAGKSRCV
jgi:hypothetical protein